MTHPIRAVCGREADGADHVKMDVERVDRCWHFWVILTKSVYLAVPKRMIVKYSKGWTMPSDADKLGDGDGIEEDL